MKTFELRDYQSELIDKVRVKMQAGARSIIAQAPTGAGKTALAVKMIGTAAQRGTRGLFLVHRRELVRQTIKAFAKVGLRHGLIAAGYMSDRGQLVQLGSVQTYSRRWPKHERPGLVVWDECHHIAAASWSSIHRALPQAFHVGLSATPKRKDGEGLGQWFTELVTGPSVAWLIENGWLSQYRIVVPPGIDVTGVGTKMGDFAKPALSAAADRPTITGDAVRMYKKHCSGARAIAFCVRVDHSKHVAAQFNAAGIAAAHVDGETPIGERDDALERFERGDIRVLCNVDLFGEGFDLPSIEACILLRPTQSETLYLQQVGRALRPAPGKNFAVILDHAGNVGRHGLPDDERLWTLEGSSGRAAAAGAGRAPIKVCKKCFAVNKLSAMACNFCGFIPDPREAEAIEHVEGELQEIEPAIIRLHRQREQAAARGLEDLILLGRRRGYQHPRRWAENVYRARQAQG